jgi:mono/diheme cytochrome c family protein
MARFHALLLPFLALAAEARAAAPIPEHLRDTGLYAPGNGQEIAADVLPFSPQYPLWSDGAEKRRWIRLPRGTRIDARDPDRWVFPVGTRLWKEFALGRRLETRMLERTRAGWRFATYLWTEDGSDALLAPEEGVRTGVPLPDGSRWAIPGTADCKACHEGQPNPVLGFTALQLSSDRDPGAPHARTAPAEVHLGDLLARGLLQGLPAALRNTPPRIPAHSADERAALGYLHANCGVCHNRRGPLAGIGLDLLQSLAEGPASVERTRASALAVRALRPVGEAQMRLDPGRPEHSVLFRRMGARDPLDQMPPLGTEKPDRAALALVERWIHSLADRRTP